MAYTSNPFDAIIEHLNNLEEKVTAIGNLPHTQKIEIINREELCKRLDITEPTAITWEKKGKIPSFRIGSNVRYNWPLVIEALSK